MFANDRLKFRGWDHDGARMLTVEEAQEALSMLDWNDALSDIDFMQATGVCDTKGTVIFEGDIITSEDENNDDLYAILWSDTLLTFVFVRVEEGLLENSERIANLSCDLLCDSLGDDDVIVGNIFENKELLEC